MTGAAGGDRSNDPVLVRRARIARLCSLGQQLGLGLFGVAIVAFVAGAVTSFSGPVTAAVIGSLALGSLFLAPAIVFGHAVHAAEREDRERGSGAT